MDFNNLNNQTSDDQAQNQPAPTPSLDTVSGTPNTAGDSQKVQDTFTPGGQATATPTEDSPQDIEKEAVPAQNVPVSNGEPAEEATVKVNAAPEQSQTTSQPETDWTKAGDEDILNADLIKELDLDGLPDQEKTEFLNKMADTVQDASFGQIIKKIPEDKQAEFDKVLDQNDPKKTLEFIEANVPDADKLTSTELVNFKKAMLTGEVPKSQE